MSTPAAVVSADTQVSAEVQADGNSDLSFEQKVNAAVDAATQDDKGNLVLSVDLSDDIKFAARSEKRRRDTQSALAKATSAKSILEVENEELKKLVMQSGRIELSPDDQAELDELKHSDPDAWRAKMNALEQNVTSTTTTKLTEISDNAKTTGTVGERQVLLEAFQHDNPELVIDDDVLANEVPPRITRALETGEVTFMEFLGNVKTYLEATKVIGDNKPADSGPNLSNVAGNDVPGQQADAVQVETNYEKMIF